MKTLEQEKSELSQWLHTAMGIELSTIPLYMTALISIKPGKNRVAANLIRSVMMEEMLHLLLAGNLLSAIGGRVQFSEQNVPSFPLTLNFQGKQFREREFEANLAPFSAASIEVFTEIELPEGWGEPPQLQALQEIDVPGYTIGEFYDALAHKLAALCEVYGERAVFSGNPQHQLGLNYYWGGGGKPIVITSLALAREAIEVIVTQGEGTRGAVYDDDSYFSQPEEVAHFFRFREIQFARHYRPGDDPRQPPTGAAFEVDYVEVYPIKANPKATDYLGDPEMAALNEQFNRLYSLMLYQIAEALNGASGAMYTAILNSMHDMTGTALQMVATPIANDPDGHHGAPTFEWVPPAL
ncbi:ferritin-like protein [Pseudomonas sp.]|uniref:ferritin-like domain-containing protein n=1 Tax=Pseudomonas sp. TaxID=306 RepID=UPI0028B0C0A2|nr:ferritin-like protein [Pseudomonas sp.]